MNYYHLLIQEEEDAFQALKEKHYSSLIITLQDPIILEIAIVDLYYSDKKKTEFFIQYNFTQTSLIKQRLDYLHIPDDIIFTIKPNLFYNFYRYSNDSRQSLVVTL